MYNGFGVNYKKHLQEALAEEMTKYIKGQGLTDILGLPLLGYAFTNDKRFMDAFDAGLTKHPKEIYRPGTTVIVSFLPFLPEYVQDNFIENNNVNAVSKAWAYAYDRSIIVSAHINTFILDFLEEWGREASLSTPHTDWNRDSNRPEWSHKIAAHIAGMGEFGPNGCIRTEYGPWGRFSSILTEVQLEPSGKNHTNENGINEETYDEINIAEDYMRYGLFENPVSVPQRIINACPIGAISKDGIDTVKCQEYCQMQNEFVPEPDACGRCYTR